MNRFFWGRVAARSIGALLGAALLAACAGGAPAQTGGTTATSVPAASTAGSATASGESILIGVSGPLTGSSAQYGADWKQGFDLALEQVNAAGGVNGRKVEYTFEDTQADPKQTVVIAQKFVDDQRIVVELGDFSSTASMAASPIYQRAGLVQFGFTNSNPKFTQGGDFMWSNSISQADNAPFLAGYGIKDLGFKKIAVFHRNDDYGKSAFDLLQQAITAQGAEVVDVEPYLPDDKDFRSAITKVKAANPDGIILSSYAADAALIVQQLRAQGITTPVLADASAYSPDLLKLGGQSVEGMYTTTEFFPEEDRPEVQAFVKAFKAKYNEDPGLFQAIAYDAVNIVVAAMKESGTERAQIKEGLGKIKDVPSVLYGKLAFNANRRVDNPQKIRLVIKDGKFAKWDGAVAK